MNPSSPTTGTPRLSALSSFEPAFSPATTSCVFFETDDATLPPRSVTAAAAESRVKPSREPVMTTVIPSSGCGPDVDDLVGHAHAAAAPLLDDVAVPVLLEPLPDGLGDDRRRPRRCSASSSTDAVDDRVERVEPPGQALRSGGSDVPDRQRDEDPPQRLPTRDVEVREHGARVLGQLDAVLALARLAGEERAAEQVGVRRAGRGRPRPARARSRAGRSRPCSRGPRCRTPRGRRRGTAARASGPGSCGRSGSGCPCRPPSPACSGVPHSGQRVGITNARSLPSRSSSTGPSTSGMTSPALRRKTMSPMSTPLRSHLEGVVQGRHRHRRAGDAHRLHHRERRHAPGASDVDLDVAQARAHDLRRVLVGDRPPRRARRLARAAAAARCRRP